MRRPCLKPFGTSVRRRCHDADSDSSAIWPVPATAMAPEHRFRESSLRWCCPLPFGETRCSLMRFPDSGTH